MTNSHYKRFIVATVALTLAALLLAPVAVATPVHRATPASPPSAKAVYLHAWDAVNELLDAPQSPAPRLVLGLRPGKVAWVAGDESGMRAVKVGDKLWDWLGGKAGPRYRLAALQIIVHEFAHVYQGFEVFEGARPLDMPVKPTADPWWIGKAGDLEDTYEGLTEGLAEAWAVWVMRVKFGHLRADYEIPGFDVYDLYAEEMREVTTPAYIRRGQFDEYLGYAASGVPY